MTEREIIIALARLWSPRKYICAYHCSALGWESDYLVLHRSGYADEIEIKVSYSDFKAEFAKKGVKHRALCEGQPGRKWEGYNVIPDWSKKTPCPIRRFWFAAPAALAEKIAPELPEYAGLITVEMRRSHPYATRIRTPKVLPNHRKITEVERQNILVSMYYKAWRNFK